MTETIEHTPPPLPPSGPALGTTRIQSLDVLRGVALMGILVMNIQSFSMPMDAYMKPAVFGDLTGANAWVWILSHVFFELKFMAMFSMMFGAGVLLMSQHRDRAGKAVTALHYRRMILLLVFGLIHAYLIWYGDILVAYALCGMAVFWARGWPAGWLAVAGAGLITVGCGIHALAGVSTVFVPESADEIRAEVSTPEELQEEVGAYRGSWLDHLPFRAEAAVSFHTFVFPLIYAWRIAGLMFLGMALYKWGVLSAERSTGFYLLGAALGALAGLPLAALSAYLNWQADFDMAHVIGFGALPNWFGSVPVAFMWICLVMLLMKLPALGFVKSALSAYGQTAFTNYIGQSVLATFVFYGYGLGWFGQLDRIEQMGVVAAIWAVQLVFATVWLRFFKFGPLEWLWRTGAYLKAQPMLR
jgi:uncharacterized protein